MAWRRRLLWLCCAFLAPTASASPLLRFDPADLSPADGRRALGVTEATTRPLIALKFRRAVPYRDEPQLPAGVLAALGSRAGMALTHVGATKAGLPLLALPDGTTAADAMAASSRLEMHRDVLWSALAVPAPGEAAALARPLAADIPAVEFSGRFLVRFDDPATRRAAAENGSLAPEDVARVTAALGVGARVLRPMSRGAWVFAFDVPLRTELAEDLILRLRQTDGIAEAELSRPLRAQAATPSDPYYLQDQYNLQPVAPNAADAATLIHGIDAAGAWNVTTGASTTVVAVVDTGVLPTHPELAGRILTGYDFVARQPGGYDSGTYCPATGEASSWHGSHVAGIIGAAANNGLGIAGIDWNAALLPVRVLGQCGSGSLEDIVDGMQWAAGLTVPGTPANTSPARIINMSLGGTGSCSPFLQGAIDEVMESGALVVVAAGNDNTTFNTFWPASCNGVVTVAASDPLGNKASYSNYGTSTLVPDLAAPGGDISRFGIDWGILSLGNAGIDGPAQNIWQSLQGTSMATPHVSGVASLMIAANPTLTASELRSLLVRSARPFAAYSDFRTNYPRGGQGFLDARAAVDAAVEAGSRASFTPLSGLWSIDAERNGKPGRGLQIDVQGSTLVLTVYAYDGTGQGTFYLASGNLDAGNVFSETLYLYADGNVFGAPFRNARLVGSAGKVRIAFTDGASGVITFPGETPKAISRFVFGVDADPGGLLGEWFAVSVGGPTRAVRFLGMVSSYPDDSGFSSGEVGNSADTARCARNIDGTWQNRVVCATGAHLGLGELATVDHIFALEYSGNEGFGTDYDIARQDVSDLYLLRTTTRAGRNTGGNLSGFAPSPASYTPQAGLWAISSELNGGAGRGFQLDVQGDVLVLTVFAYDATGKANFYLASGTLSRSGYFSGTLDYYSGGTRLGGVQRDAVLAGTAGNVEIQFDDATHGRIRFPGEGVLEIAKYRFGIAETPAGLLGEWVFAYRENGIARLAHETLTRTGVGSSGYAQGVALGADGSFACGRDTAGTYNNRVVCTRANVFGMVTEAYYWEFSGNQGDGVHRNMLTGVDAPMWAWRLVTQEGRRTVPYVH